MGCIIVMMPRQEDAIRLKDIIRHSGIWENVVVSRRGSETLEIAASREVDVVLCPRRMADMGYEELRSYLPTQVAILLLTKDASLVPFGSNVVKLLMPFRTGDLVSSLSMLLPGAYDSGRKKKKPPGRSPEEQRVIDDAKAVLMARNGMTEPEAFRYIQKSSMDTSRSMLETAQMILMLNGG